MFCSRMKMGKRCLFERLLEISTVTKSVCKGLVKMKEKEHSGRSNMFTEARKILLQKRNKKSMAVSNY